MKGKKEPGIKLNDPQRAFKLLREMRSGNIRPLFIGKTQDLPLGQWLRAEAIPTKGFAFRPGWHVMDKPSAPHLGQNGRAWYEVLVDDCIKYRRPESQGGIWYLAKWMKIEKRLEDELQI